MEQKKSRFTDTENKPVVISVGGKGNIGMGSER